MVDLPSPLTLRYFFNVIEVIFQVSAVLLWVRSTKPNQGFGNIEFDLQVLAKSQKNQLNDTIWISSNISALNDFYTWLCVAIVHCSNSLSLTLLYTLPGTQQ